MDSKKHFKYHLSNKRNVRYDQVYISCKYIIIYENCELEKNMLTISINYIAMLQFMT